MEFDPGDGGMNLEVAQEPDPVEVAADTSASDAALYGSEVTPQYGSEVTPQYGPEVATQYGPEVATQYGSETMATDQRESFDVAAEFPAQGLAAEQASGFDDRAAWAELGEPNPVLASNDSGSSVRSGDGWQMPPEFSPVGGLTISREPPTSSTESDWTPPRLTQGQVSDRPGDGDCFLVSTLNRIAESPGGMDHLRSQVKDVGNGFYEVTLRDKDNQPSTILLQHPESSDSAIPSEKAPATGDWTLRLYERAMAIHNDPTLAYSTDTTPEGVYRNSMISAGGYPHVAMQQLGLEVDRSGVHPNVALEQHRIFPERPVVMATFEKFLPGEETYNLANRHAYELERTVRLADETQVVLRDPRNGEWTYVPESQLARLVQYGTQGRIPGR